MTLITIIVAKDLLLMLFLLSANSTGRETAECDHSILVHPVEDLREINGALQNYFLVDITQSTEQNR